MEENKIINAGVGTLKLRKAISIDGKNVTEINYDFDKLTGENIENVFKESTRSGYMVSASYELDPVIGGRMFAEASDLDFSDIKRLGVSDYSKVASIARDFFIIGLNGDQDDQN